MVLQNLPKIFKSSEESEREIMIIIKRKFSYLSLFVITSISFRRERERIRREMEEKE